MIVAGNLVVSRFVHYVLVAPAVVAAVEKGIVYLLLVAMLSIAISQIGLLGFVHLLLKLVIVLGVIFD